jgi:hypothetical protein
MISFNVLKSGGEKNMTNENKSPKPKNLFGSIKKRSKIALTALMAMVFTVIASLTVFGADTDPFSDSGLDIAGSMGTALGEMVTMIFEVIVVILPIALMIIGAVVAIRRGISLMQSLVQR